MNNSSKSISLILAAGLAGVASFQLANSSFSAALPGDVFIAIAVSAAVIGFAAYDYSRRIQPLRLPNRLLRPTLPARAATGNPATSAKFVRQDKIAA